MTTTPTSLVAEVNGQTASAKPAGILVVDDDPLILRLLQTFLSLSGFIVWTANGGRSALAVYESHRNEIDVVLLDVRMPDMDGPLTLRELRSLNPNVTCCFMSGHTGAYSDDALRSLGALAIFAKPFQLDELAQSLRAIVC